ncbi:uncharacterized protein DEA37_0002444, partial [Paragonimus westermani]
MEDSMSRKFWWSQQRRDITNFCNHCTECLWLKNPHMAHRAPLRPIITGYPNSIVEMDIIGPLPETSRANRYILVLVDH